MAVPWATQQTGFIHRVSNIMFSMVPGLTQHIAAMRAVLASFVWFLDCFLYTLLRNTDLLKPPQLTRSVLVCCANALVQASGLCLVSSII